MANAAPRCGARSKRTGKPCRAAAMPNGRCKVHGGKSTGPRTPEGLERSKRKEKQIIFFQSTSCREAISCNPGRRRQNADHLNTSVVRTRRYLTGREVEKLIEAARKHGRYRHRDATMILLAYRHGLRASELVRSAMAPGHRLAATSEGAKRAPPRCIQ